MASTWTTTDFVIEGFAVTSSEWISVYGPDAKLDLEETRTRVKQLRQLCPDLKIRVKRFDNVHRVDHTVVVLDDAALEL